MSKIKTSSRPKAHNAQTHGERCESGRNIATL